MLADIIITVLCVYVLLNVGSLYSEWVQRSHSKKQAFDKQRAKDMGL